MKKILKLALATLTLVSVVILALMPVFTSYAAPAALPGCGDSPVSDASDNNSSGPPSAAQSADGYYTAVAWAQGTSKTDPVGSIMLAYSNILTDTQIGKSWNRIIVDSVDSDSNRDPSIAFDPDDNNLIHVAYRKKGTIYYKRCDLNLASNQCNLEKQVTTEAANIIDLYPQIAIMDGTTVNTVTIVYQRRDETGGTGNNGKNKVQYAFIGDSGSGSLDSGNDLTDNDPIFIHEKDPTVVFANGRLHLAYTRDNKDSSPGAIQYGALTEETLGSTLNPITSFSMNGSDVEPNFPVISARDNIIALVWQVKAPGAETYYLAYETSSNNGVNWNNAPLSNNYYKYLFTGNGSNNTGRGEWDTQPSDRLFVGGLKPNTFMSDFGLHTVWQSSPEVHHDVMYSYLHSPATNNLWQTNRPAAITPTMEISYTNLTAVYRGNASSKRVEPAVLFGEPGRRLQVFYILRKDLTGPWDIYYNGWQLSDNDDDILNFEDTDCDGLPDPDENSTSISCPVIPEGNLFAGYPDCDEDGIPNFMDEDADGDGINDYWGDDPNPFDGGAGLPKVYLPIVIKA
jgi:hypothetical protein